MLRRCCFALVFTSLAGLGLSFGGSAVGQDKKPVEKKPDDKKMEDKKTEVKPEDKDKPKVVPVEPEDQSFKSADGVKLVGKLYKTAKGAAPVVLMLHDYKANPNEAVWEDTAQLLANRGYNVFRFDFRGHGKSLDVVPGEFWLRPENKSLINLGGVNPSLKSTIKFTEFKQNYFPMLVQDIAAARNVIDQLNDNGVVNASTIYLLGAGDSAGLGMLYLASEWSRERQKPNVGVVAQYVSPNRPLFPTAEPAGGDFGGAVWLGPTRNVSMSTQIIKDWVLSPRTINLRTETSMLFIHAEKDTKSAPVAKFLYKDALMVESRTNPSTGQKLLRPEQTFVREIKGSAAAGAKLLGNKLGTEDMVEKFLKAVDSERKSKTRKTREWDKPLFIEVTAFGVCRLQ